MELAPDIQKLSSENPRHAKFIHQLFSHLSSCSPPFIYINDPNTPRITSTVVHSLLECMSQAPNSPGLHFAHVNAVTCFTSRLFYDAVLNALADWHPTWEDGCENWSAGGSEQRVNDGLDGFLHGLRAIATASTPMIGATRKGKEKAVENAERDTRLIVAVDKPERLKESLPDLFIPLTKLNELSQVNATTIFISGVRWEDIRPSLGASPDPYFFEIPPPTKETTLHRLTQSFLTASPKAPTYHPSLLPLYEHFAELLFSVCANFTPDPDELAYISAARWPGFVESVLDAQGERTGDRVVLPAEDVRMRLLRKFTPSITAAMNALYPRLMDADAWAEARARDEHDITSQNPGTGEDVTSTIGLLPRMAKFLLVAAFLASTNPPKTDLRMFGRGLDEKKRRRRGGGGIKPRKGGGEGKVAKIPQRLSGPKPFPLDRLIAILGVLLEENDADTRPPAPEFLFPGEYTDMEIGRTQVYALIMELAANKLLYRTSPPEKLDGPPMFKCGISREVALGLARELDVPLNDLTWDPV